MDEGHKLTDKKLEKLIRKLDKVYSQAAKETEAKLNDYMRRFKIKDAIKQRQVKAGEISHEEWINWRVGQVAVGQRWEEMRNTLAEDLTNVDKIAVQMVGESMYDVYALNHNFGTFEVEKGYLVDTSYTLYDRQTVERLVKGNPTLLKAPSLDINKDYRWNAQNFQSAITQSILQGEDIRKTAKRVALGTTKKDRNAAVRNARTATTNAENAGRCDSYKRAEKMGIKLKQVWLAALDGRTRDSHRRLDGEKIPAGEKFSNGLRFPGDPQGAAHEVWNCRCTLIAEVEGVGYDLTDVTQRNSKLGGMSYEEWKSERGVKSANSNNDHYVVDGKDISTTWKRRADQFDSEIDDIINAQGFDGLPRVVSKEEFNKAVKVANGGQGFIAQRTYSAPDQETLDAYREQLYSGKWYVDCSNGGCAYGKGMYSAYANNTEITDYIKREMQGYSARRGIDYNYIETFTLTPDAKTITPNKIIELRNTIQKNIFDGIKERGGWGDESALAWATERGEILSLDDGSFAAVCGYDAILTNGMDNYAIILNRTKVIFLGGN